MVEYLSMTALGLRQLLQLTAISTVTIISLSAGSARAELLTDPTQPPGITGGATEAVTGPVLQSVMIGPKYHAAIISGQMVLLGKKYGEATLIHLSNQEAVLRNPDMTTQTLVIDYAIEKKPVLPAEKSKATGGKAQYPARQGSTR
jgi:MSHA biogenesis protein MshK